MTYPPTTRDRNSAYSTPNRQSKERSAPKKPSLMALSMLVTISTAITLFATTELFAEATVIHYSGSLVPAANSVEGATEKRFNVTTVVRSENSQRKILFLVDERGGSGWAWPERFGELLLDDNGRVTNSNSLRILHDHLGNLFPIDVRPPYLPATQTLAEGAAWQVEKDRFRIVGQSKKLERECWKIDVENNFGHRATIWLDRDSQRIVELQERITIGRGDRYRLTLKIENETELSGPDLEKLNTAAAGLLQLKKSLDRKARETKPELSSDQLAMVSDAIEQLQADASGTVFERLAETIQRDTTRQLKRTGDVATLAQKYLGKPAPQLNLTTLTNRPVQDSAHDGKIVLLHFWSYRGDPPSEPYGQVGYLDFLNSKRQKLGVKVYGVAVDARLADDAQRGRIIRQIQKLQEFMNIGYEVTWDDGSLLKQFGDPRSAGAKLPLWVLIDQKGVINQYHVGFFDIRPEEGLKALDDQVIELIKKGRDTSASE